MKAMDREPTQRVKRQPNGLLEPYTVMLEGQQVVVRARSVIEAAQKAQAEVDKIKVNKKVEAGDGS